MSVRGLIRKARDVPPVGRALALPLRLARRAGLELPERLFRHFPYHGPFSVPCPGGGSFVMLAYGHQVENNLYWRGILGNESECIMPWISFAKTARTVLDIGANTGLYSLLTAAVSPEAEIHAFEPVERIFGKLRANCEMNPRFKITPHRSAVGAREGSVTLYDPGGDHAYSASLDPDFLPEADMRPFPVDCVTVDAFVEREGLSPDLVKIDVEGCEAMVLAGMERTLERCAPVVMLESLPRYVPRLRAPLEKLLARGYLLHTMGEDGMRPAAGVFHSPESWNVMLVPGGRPDHGR